MATVGLPLLTVPQIGLVGLSLIQPLFLDRYVLFSLLGPALLIGTVIGSAVQAVKPRLPRASTWVLPAVIAVAMVTLLPQSPAKRSPSSRVDDVLAVASDIRRIKETGDAVLFVPTARRDTKSVTPSTFSGLRDRMKTSVLKKYFKTVADQQVHGRRVTVYERLAPAR
nr:hypothetical protein [Streptomyces sp. TLI_185]